MVNTTPNLHVGLIGAGSWARVHLAALEAMDLVSQVTLCARDLAAAAKLAREFSKVSAVVAEPARLCDDPAIDVVDIVLPHDLHAPTTLLALAAGKHVVCEKPGAITLSDFDRLAAAAEAAGRRWLVVMNQLYNPRLERVVQLVADGLVGRPFLLVENGYSNHSKSYRDPLDWRTKVARAGGGVLIDGGYHMVYKQLELLAGFGEPAWVTGETAQLNLNESGGGESGSDVSKLGEDFVQYTLGYESVKKGGLHAGEGLRVASSHAWTLESSIARHREGFLAGSGGTLEMPDGIDGPITLRQAGRANPVDLPAPLADPRPDTLRLCLSDSLAAIAENRPPRHGGRAAARRTLAVIQGVYEAAGRVRLEA
ncbi:MAG: Gfo/Idh/MocA family oxidoreductase [Planctomycetia bacterium]|nr:Gfo/Idh/MocA family oxidoreductase [Planctomycetia bacterium]